MMNNTLSEEIRIRRRRIGLTQSKLAKISGVSQSLITKIESGRIDPAYSKVVQILGALDDASGNLDVPISHVMQNKVIYVSPNTKVDAILKKLKKHGFSQLPVMDGGMVLGIISESTLLDAFLKGKHDNVASDVMADAPPVVSPDTKSSVVSEMIKYFPIILVGKKGKIRGIVTKADIIQYLY